jgi:hypothetical protein
MSRLNNPRMARRIRTLYRWAGSELEPAGTISEAALRAWEYSEEPQEAWMFASGEVKDTVRRWKTARPDLRVPPELLVGDDERPATV